MKNAIKSVEEFHIKFSIPVGRRIGDTTLGQQSLHYELMNEELLEFKDAYEKEDLVGIADGLADVMFVLLSSVAAHGLQGCFSEISQEVCDSNMSKLGEDGKPVYRADGKIMKGKNFVRPDIKKILDKYMAQEIVKDQIDNV